MSIATASDLARRVDKAASIQYSGQRYGPDLDMNYLISLGSAEILPPVEARMAQFPSIVPPPLAHLIAAYRDHFLRAGNWRAWSYRAWRLERYLGNNPDAPPNFSDSGKG